MSIQPITLAWLETDDGSRVELSNAFSIGRSNSCDLTLSDSKVSRKHATIVRQGETEFWLSDLGSSNGTLVNQNRISQPVRLRNGDALRIGPFELKFFNPSDPQTTVPTQLTTQQTLIDLAREDRWLLVADIEDSTMLASSLEPEIYRRYVDEWFRKSRTLITAQKGSLNKFLGDGFLACWPVGEQSTERVAETIEAFKTMQDELPFRFRLAVHFGEIIVGGIGSAGEESLSGSEVNFAFRMEKIAGMNGHSILLSHAAREALGVRVRLEDARNYPVPGFAGEFEFHPVI